ncbi:MAG: antibiotic biosynthesis monooxygenase [Mogibacterium sp.]|nr:antibiotic biosynthesis monooxygenase [Mogibacterium sp.]
MFFNFAKFPVQEGKLEEARAALTELSAPSYIDPGCYAYQVAGSINGESALYTLEIWATLEDLDTHMKTPHIAEFEKKAAGFLAGPPEVTTVCM